MKQHGVLQNGPLCPYLRDARCLFEHPPEDRAGIEGPVAVADLRRLYSQLGMKIQGLTRLCETLLLIFAPRAASESDRDDASPVASSEPRACGMMTANDVAYKAFVRQAS